MAEPISAAPSSHCYGCLSSIKQRNLETYYIKKLKLKTILEIDTLFLCYLCKRVAIQTERFISNVERSRALFQESKYDENFTWEHSINPLIDLKYSATNSDIIVCSTDDGIKNEFEVLSDYSTEIAIKKEETTRQDTDNYYHLQSLIDDEKIQTNKPFKCLKDETEVEQDGNDFGDDIVGQNQDDLKYPLKNVKRKKAQKPQEDFCAGVLTLSKQELLEERGVRANEKKYIEATFKCTDCLKGFVMKTPYENHMKLHDKNRGAFECDICKQRLKTQIQLDHHYKYHIERFKCSKCEVTRNSFMSLKDHYSRKHSDGRLEYSCPVCYKQFRFRSTLQKHKTDKHENRERLRCKYCDKTFASDSALGYHLKFRHTEEESAKIKPYTCDECGRSFKLLQKLKNHRVTHSSRRDYYCVECDKSFKTRTALNLHFRTVVAHISNKDLQEFPFPCPHCEKRFPQKKGLDRHVKDVHLNQTLLQCSQCGKTFKTKKSLKIHILSHEDGYQQPKKHCCTVCNKRFHEKGVLAKHMNTHTGEKPFQCSQCPAQFAHNGSLYNHVKLVHLNLTRKGTPKGVTMGTLSRKRN